ncbi:MAG: hypothetical protein KDK36_09805, partial [Leptospiraceae bacterium]|nr:hypothetical protein [Leptospiraceae bacterium]
NLSFQVNNISEAREKLIKIAKINSILKNSNTNISESTEMLNAEIYTPVDKMYETILLLGNIGTLTNETVSTEDWTEHNQLQKIKTEREITRSKRRSKAASSGKAENWTWKDREELLERSEDNLDMAKMENWKIQDKIKWAKIRIYIHGGESGFKIHVPNYKNAFVSSINFFLNAIYVFLWILPFGVIIMILYFGIRWLRMRD